MMSRAGLALKLAMGRFTPYLNAGWSQEEQERVRAWLAGEELAGEGDRLEEEIRRWLGPEWFVMLWDSGTSAIRAALEAFQLEREAEVLIPTFICKRVAVAVLAAGGQPVLVDTDENFNISYVGVLQADGPRVRAIVLPHLSGCWARGTTQILEWAKHRGVWVIEDAAQAGGLTHGDGGQWAGTFSDVGVFSAGYGKPFFGPGGGWLVTKHPQVVQALKNRNRPPLPDLLMRRRILEFMKRYQISDARQGRNLLFSVLKARALGGFGQSTDHKRIVEDWPVYALSEVESYLAIRRLKEMSLMVTRQIENARRWKELLGALRLSSLRFLPEAENTHLKRLLYFQGSQALEEGRWLKNRLMHSGIQIEESYTPLHLRSPFHELRRTDMTMVEGRWRGAFSVPTRPNLGERDWSRIAQALHS